MADAYSIIGITRKASDEEIQRAYKAKARSLHPDVGGDPAAMAELNEAYAKLKTPELRRKYDAAHSFSGTMATWSAAMGKSTVARDFGKAPVQSDPRKVDGGDITVNVEVTMESFLYGVKLMTVEYDVTHECLECSGTGGETLRTCQVCNGERKIRTIVSDRDKVSTCPRCSGTGFEPVGTCPVCMGKGITAKKGAHSFRYRKGMVELKVPGKGNGGIHGGKNGNLLLRFNPQPHGGMIFDGERFLYSGHIPVEGFILGQSVELDYPGPLRVFTIPAGNEYRYSAIEEDFLGTGFPCEFTFTPMPEETPDILKWHFKTIRDARTDVVSR